jgi:hypothetical protein
MRIRLTLFLFIFGSVLLLQANDSVSPKLEFNRDIRPILSDKCFECHGPSKHKHTKMKLTRFELATKEAEDGFPIVPGKPEKSLVIDRIMSDDPDHIMPPPESHKTLSQKEKEILKRWIAQGAEYQEHWAFLAPQKTQLPAIKNKKWPQKRLDHYVLAQIEGKGLKPNKEADKRSLIRRLSFDLTGLPPSLEEIQIFLNDKSKNAYEKLVDRLLASPRYGEHMTKYWLDLVRFADTNGGHHDLSREMSPYRDWVIRAFNNNLRFDTFIKFNVAGDLYKEPTQDQLVASGFNRLHVSTDGPLIPQEAITINVVDRVSSIGTVFLGLTLNCAVCHDHKFDPITQKDFYQLYAFFNNIDGGPLASRRAKHHKPFIYVMNKKQKKEHETLKAKPAALKKFEAGLESTLIMREKKGAARPSFILKRGVYNQFGEKVGRETPACLPTLKSKNKSKDRMDLAEWLVWKKNPLPARVAVNRFWQQIFGRGIVGSSEDFGSQGDVPTHPELLDYLTSEFIASNWDVKKLMKKILMSATYKQDSAAPVASFINDTHNRFLSRGARFRLDSEMIRDQILYVSGLLVENMYGHSVKPPQPPDLWKSVSMPFSNTRVFKADSGDKIYKRSLYTYIKRSMPPPQMSIFDAPNRENCISRRERTNTPLQALVLMNEEQVFFACKKTAERILAFKKLTENQRLNKLYELVSSKLPDAKELSILRKGLKAFRQDFKTDLEAWTMLVNTLFSMDIMKTKD